jgi:hypothetical protein
MRDEIFKRMCDEEKKQSKGTNCARIYYYVSLTGRTHFLAYTHSIRLNLNKSTIPRNKMSSIRTNFIANDRNQPFPMSDAILG